MHALSWPIPQGSEFKMLGNLVSMSAMQGGPGFPVLLPAAYDYITTGQYHTLDLTDSDVPDHQVRSLLAEVCWHKLTIKII